MTPDRRTFLVSGGVTVAGLLTPDVSAQHQPADPPAAPQDCIAAHATKMTPLEVSANLAWWNASISGKDEDFQKKEDAQNKSGAALSDTKLFDKLKVIKAANDASKIKDKQIARQVELLYLMYLEKQVPTDLLKKI